MAKKSRSPYYLLGLVIAGFVVFYPTKKNVSPTPSAPSVSAAPAKAEAAPAARPTPAAIPATAPAPRLMGAAVIRYEMPDGVVGFTDDEKRVPGKATRVVKGYRAADGRWTYSGPASWHPSTAFRPTPPSPEEGVWRAEQRRHERELDEARALARAFPGGDLGGALEQRVRDAERRMSILEDDCRRSRACEPGFLR